MHIWFLIGLPVVNSVNYSLVYALGKGELERGNHAQFTPAPLSSKEVQQPASGFTSLEQLVLDKGAAGTERAKASARRTLANFIVELNVPF